MAGRCCILAPTVLTHFHPKFSHPNLRVSSRILLLLTNEAADTVDAPGACTKDTQVTNS